MYRQIKRSAIEYRKQKVFGRKRDSLKAKLAQRAKGNNKPRKTKKNKLKRKKYRKTSTYKHIPHEYRRTASQISKLKFITVDSAKTEMLQSKNKTMPYLKQDFYLPPLACVGKISVDRNIFVIRYYNQYMFIYKASVGKNRPLKRNLIGTFSTLNEDEMESNWHTEYTRFSPIKQPRLITQHNINSSQKKATQSSPENSSSNHRRTHAWQ